MADATARFTPVNLLTGFLGSGKTTLLRRLLHDPALADTAVLINEFGEVGLDHHLLERIDERMVLLRSGCVCCTIRGELSDAVRDLHSRRTRGDIPHFTRLVIESTGLADPFPVLTTLRADPVLRHHFRMGHVVTTVDAVLGAGQLARFPESVKQAAVAVRLVLTKADLAGPADIASLRSLLGRVNPAAPMIDAAAPDLDCDGLLAGEPPAPAAPGRWLCDAPVPDASVPDASAHGGGVRAFAMTLDGSLDWTAFGIWLTMLLDRHGERVLRVKGILNVAGEDAPVAIHGVQHLVHPPVHMRAWPDGDQRSRLVFIVDGLDGAAIRRSLATFARDPCRAPAFR